MAIFFFDIADGNDLYREERGFEFADLDRATDAARVALLDLVRDGLSSRHPPRHLSITVADEHGTELVVLTMDFSLRPIGLDDRSLDHPVRRPPPRI